MSGIIFVPASSSIISPPATVRLRLMYPLPLTRSPNGASAAVMSCSPRFSGRCFLRARVSRFLRKSVRTLRFFADMRRGSALLYRVVREFDLAGLHVRGGVALGIVCGVPPRFAFQLAMVEAGAGKQRLLHNLLRIRKVVRRRRTDGAELDRIVVDTVLVLGDRENIARVDAALLHSHVVDLD